jgi:microcystin-dependent protein
MDTFIAQIEIFPFAFAPKGYALCNGQALPISQNTALYRLLGNIYGGDGKTTFALPNLQGAVPIGVSDDPTMGSYELGQAGGKEAVALAEENLPVHTHALNASTATGKDSKSTQNQLARGIGGSKAVGSTAVIYSTILSRATTPLSPASIAGEGASAAHPNMMPYISLNFCIALQGSYPPQS